MQVQGNRVLSFPDSLPVCESNLTKNYSYSLIEGDHIFIQCNINFRGFWAPSVEWTQHGDNSKPEGEPVADGVEQLRNPSQSITSTLTIAVQSSADGFYYSCKLYFVKYNGIEVTTAKNVPNFTYTWNSSVTQHIFSATSPTTETSSSVYWCKCL